jgi:hypothetical protein
MKRLVLVALILSTIGVVGISEAKKYGPCDTNVAVGDHGDATVTFADADGHTVNIHTAAFGNFAVGPVNTGSGHVNKCPPGLSPTTGYVTVTVDGANVCTNTSKPPAFDPFVFGGGIHDATTDPCGADVTWDGLSWLLAPAAPPGPPDPPAVGASLTPNELNVWAGDEQPAIVDGIYWYGGITYAVPGGTVGWFSNHGAQVQVKRGINRPHPFNP